MKYLCLIHEDEQKLAAMPQEEVTALIGACMAYTGELVKGGHHLMSLGLQCAATSVIVRRRGGEWATTDGPFAETKEQLGGFFLIDARDLNEAIQLVSKFPSMSFASIEIRPAMELQPQQTLTPGRDAKIGAALRSLVPQP